MMSSDNSANYPGFDIADFVCDPFFQDWIIHPDTESDAFWQDWLRQYPGKAELVQQAGLLLGSVKFAEFGATDEEASRSLAGALDIIAQRSRGGKIRRLYEDAVRIRPLYKIAAAIIIVVAAALLYSLPRHSSARQRYETAYGAMQSVYLPDSSKMVLNSHSTVQYAKNWKDGHPRELWLKGEAFFDVRHPAPGPAAAGGYGSFLVYTKDLAVEVLGTAFDVRERRGRTEVVLQSGRIRVKFLHADEPDIIMKPGDKIVYDPQQASITRAAITPENYTSWRDRRLTNATGRQIVEYLEDNYGKKVILEDTTMATHRFGGDVMLDKFDDALFALSTVMNVQIIQKNDTLFFRPK